MTDIYFLPTKKAQPITLAQLKQHFVATGLPCAIEDDSVEIHWLVFESHESTLCVSTTGGHVTLVTFNFGAWDDTSVGDTVERIMDSIGFSADEQADER